MESLSGQVAIATGAARGIGAAIGKRLAFAPMMIASRSGHIVNISSLTGHNPLKNGAAYAASKWG